MWLLAGVVIGIAFCVDPSLEIGGIVSDPVADYISTPPINGDRDVPPPDRLDYVYRMEADFRGDGKKYVLVSAKYMSDNYDCLAWQIYHPVDGGYKALMYGLNFDPEKCRIGKIPGIPGEGVIVCSRLGPSERALSGLTINEEGLPRSLGFKALDMEKESDVKFLEDYFKDSRPYEKIDVSKLPQPRKSREETKEKNGSIAEAAGTETAAPGAAVAPAPTVAPSDEPAGTMEETNVAAAVPAPAQNEPVAAVPQPQVPIESPAPQSEHRMGVYAVAAVVLILLLVAGVWIVTKRKRT